MTDKDIKVLGCLREEYQVKLRFNLPKIDPEDVKMWMYTFNTFWRYVDPHKLSGDTLQLRRISAVFLMREAGLNVPEIVYYLMMARKMEIEGNLS
jgi:hypothetical protein